MIVLMILFVFCLFLAIFTFFTRKYVNPYKLIMIFGKKGCGKTTYLTKIAYQHYKSGWTVFSTCKIPYAHIIDADIIGQYWLPEHSVLLVDEVGMIWDNRDFKNFKNSVRDWFKYQRHNRVKVYLFSQSFDIDKKLRDLCDGMFLLTNFMRVFSYGRKISKNFVLNKSTADSPSNIAENLEFEPFIFFFIGTRTLTFIPRWSKYFDSHDRLDLPDFDLVVPFFLPDQKKGLSH